jgi:tRNA(Ile)-lysidine synthase
VEPLAATPRAVRTRVLRLWALRAGAGELAVGHVRALDALVADWHGQGPVDLPGGLRVVRESGTLVANPSSRGPSSPGSH